MQKSLFNVGIKRTGESSSTAQTNKSNETGVDSSTSSKKKKGRTARVATVKKWNYEWLEYEENDGIVHKIWCKYCKEFPDIAQSCQNVGQQQFVDCQAYINGTSNVKLNCVKSHENTDGHQDAKKAHVARYKPTETPIFKSVRLLQKDEQEKMVKLFNAAYYIVKNEMAFKDFPGLVKFEAKQGVELGQTYCNANACRKFAEAISDVFENDLKSTLAAKRPGSYLSILFDGANDKSLSEREVVCVKYMEKSGVPTTKFIGLVSTFSSHLIFATTIKDNSLHVYFLQCGCPRIR